MSAHRHLAERELLHLALADADVRRRELAGCAACTQALAELGSFLADCRDAAATYDAPRAVSAGLAADVLARTTREDPSWRGDLRLVRGFVAQRLRSSRVLRIAAASVVAHLIALPVFAWLAFRAAPAERGFVTAIELPRVPTLPDGPAEPERRPERVAPVPIPRLFEHDLRTGAERAADALATRRAERLLLALVQAPEVDPSGGPPATSSGASPAERLLWARSVVLGGRRLPEFAATAAPQEATALERALRAEVQLDHLVLTGERAPGLEATLAALATLPTPEGRPDATQTPRAERVLEALALRRAAACGLLSPERERTARLRAAELGLTPSPVGGSALDPAAWSAELQRALAAQGAAGTRTARGWASFGERVLRRSPR